MTDPKQTIQWFIVKGSDFNTASGEIPCIMRDIDKLSEDCISYKKIEDIRNSALTLFQQANAEGSLTRNELYAIWSDLVELKKEIIIIKFTGQLSSTI